MKNIYLFSITFFLTALSFGQNAPIDFETGGNGDLWTWTVFENTGTPPPLQIIANPVSGGINNSSTVAAFTALIGGQPWAGCESMHGTDIGTFTLNPSTSEIRIMVYKTVISDVGIKLVDASSASLGEIKVANTVINQWEELVFDFTVAEGITYDQIVVFPDFDLAGRTSDNLCYFDNITFGPQGGAANTPINPAPTPTVDANLVISMFSDAYTDVAVDTWQTGWSSGTVSDIAIMANATKLYSGLDFVGIETTGSNLIDASLMETFHIDVWSPNATEFRIKLVDFGADAVFGGGDDTEHELIYTTPAIDTWITYEIPLSDFTGLMNTSHIAQLILSANPGGSSTVYIDNVFYSKPPVNTTGIDTDEVLTVSVFPNPTSGIVQFETGQPVDQIRVFNLIGEEVINISSTSNNLTIVDLSGLETGQYIIRLKSGEFYSVSKIAKY